MTSWLAEWWSMRDPQTVAGINAALLVGRRAGAHEDRLAALEDARDLIERGKAMASGAMADMVVKDGVGR